MLTSIDTVSLHVVPVGSPGHGLDIDSNLDPGLVYGNFCKNYRSHKNYGCSYEDNML